MVRIRNATSRAHGGSLSIGSNPSGNDTYIYDSRYCEDYPDLPGDCQPLIIEKSMFEGGKVTRKWDGSNPHQVCFNNYSCDWIRIRNAYGLSHLTDPHLLLDTEYAVKLRQRTNPSRSLVDMDINLLDMEHIPSAMQDEANQLLKRFKTLRGVAGSNLTWSFLVAPFISDFGKLITLCDSVEQRVKELERLTSKRGLRRTIQLDRFWTTDTHKSGSVFQSYGTFISGGMTKTTVHSVSGHARWSGGILCDTPENRRKIATQALLGLSLDFSTAWNLIPWSWFFDWFGNIGDFLKSRRNTAGAVMDVSAIMHNISTRTRSHSHVYSTSDVNMTPINCMTVSKSRALIDGSVEARMPILTAGQLGILGSIQVMNRLR